MAQTRSDTVTLGSSAATVADVVAAASGARVVLDAGAVENIGRSRGVVEAALAGGSAVYGLNTRLGAGRDTVLTTDELADFQRRVIANHVGGIGPALPAGEVRALVFARLAGFSRGGSGVRPDVADAYAALLNAGVVPVVPARGSVGAGDLTHLAAVAAVLTGAGEAFVDTAAGPAVVTGAAALAAAGLAPVELEAGEALATLSGNSYSVGVGALTVDELETLSVGADLAVALSLEAVGQHGTGGNLSPFDPAVQRAAGRTGQADAAASVLEMLTGSPLERAGRTVTVQDPLSFRTVPQLHGAWRSSIAATRTLVETELNARAENPLVDVESGRMISGGNFEVIALALVFEAMRVTLAHVASASERRIAALSELSLPMRAAGTARIPGLLWYAASANLAELRQLAAPATVGFATLSGVEDQATQAPLALQLLQRGVGLLREVLAIEVLHAAQLLPHGAQLGAAAAHVMPRLEALLGAGLPASALVAGAADVLAGRS
ncbi:aromatic amino acid ammonia-lyase [Glaciibacter sp. 2TAF33]|uniref:aromatic amino acid ammonia-lyase n=1 Tax=Glaciibacter sp. 2TAF33 TaxID=3233015 RepID=UPI003F92692B